MPKQAKNASIMFHNMVNGKADTVRCAVDSVDLIIEWYTHAHSDDHINVTTTYPKHEIFCQIVPSTNYDHATGATTRQPNPRKI